MNWYLMHIFYYYCTPHFLCSCYLASHCNKKTVHLTIEIQTETIFAIAKLLKLTQLHILKCKNVCIYVSIRRNMQLCFRCLVSLTLLHSIKNLFTPLWLTEIEFMQMTLEIKLYKKHKRFLFCLISIITDASIEKIV